MSPPTQKKSLRSENRASFFWHFYEKTHDLQTLLNFSKGTDMNIKDHISKAALLESLAEEASELAHAALKQARAIRGENPTPVTESQAFMKTIEEFTDVVHIARELNIPVDETQIENKNIRWKNRINERMVK